MTAFINGLLVMLVAVSQNVVATYLRFQVEDVIGDCEVVFKSEGRQNHAVANRKR